MGFYTEIDNNKKLKIGIKTLVFFFSFFLGIFFISANAFAGVEIPPEISFNELACEEARGKAVWRYKIEVQGARNIREGEQPEAHCQHCSQLNGTFTLVYAGQGIDNQGKKYDYWESEESLVLDCFPLRRSLWTEPPDYSVLAKYILYLPEDCNAQIKLMASGVEPYKDAFSAPKMPYAAWLIVADRSQCANYTWDYHSKAYALGPHGYYEYSCRYPDGTEYGAQEGDVFTIEANPICGNGIIEEGEECDDGLLNSDTQPDACRTNCRKAHCGDKVIDSGEDFDLGKFCKYSYDRVACESAKDCRNLPGIPKGCDECTLVNRDFVSASCKCQGFYKYKPETQGPKCYTTSSGETYAHNKFIPWWYKWDYGNKSCGLEPRYDWRIREKKVLCNQCEKCEILPGHCPSSRISFIQINDNTSAQFSIEINNPYNETLIAEPYYSPTIGDFHRFSSLYFVYPFLLDILRDNISSLLSEKVFDSGLGLLGEKYIITTNGNVEIPAGKRGYVSFSITNFDAPLAMFKIGVRLRGKNHYKEKIVVLYKNRCWRSLLERELNNIFEKGYALCSIDTQKKECDRAKRFSDLVKQKCGIKSQNGICSFGKCLHPKCINVVDEKSFKKALGFSEPTVIKFNNSEFQNTEFLKKACDMLIDIIKKGPLGYITIDFKEMYSPKGSDGLRSQGYYSSSEQDIFVGAPSSFMEDDNYSNMDLLDILVHEWLHYHHFEDLTREDHYKFSKDWKSSVEQALKNASLPLNSRLLIEIKIKYTKIKGRRGFFVWKDRKIHENSAYGFVEPYGAVYFLEDIATFATAARLYPERIARMINPGNDSHWTLLKFKDLARKKLDLLYQYGFITCLEYYDILEKAGLQF